MKQKWQTKYKFNNNRVLVHQMKEIIIKIKQYNVIYVHSSIIHQI
jgi:hypothetical protein